MLKNAEMNIPIKPSVNFISEQEIYSKLKDKTM